MKLGRRVEAFEPFPHPFLRTCRLYLLSQFKLLFLAPLDTRLIPPGCLVILVHLRHLQ